MTNRLGTWLVLCILVVYSAFTGGFVFEFTKSEAIDRLDTPFNFMLSGERTGVVGLFSENDVACAEWLALNTDGESPIYADINGFLLLTGHIEPYTQLQEPIVGKLKMGEEGYIFLTEWNAEHNQMIYHTGQPGFRAYVEILDVVKDKDVIFKSGQAAVYK